MKRQTIVAMIVGLMLAAVALPAFTTKKNSSSIYDFKVVNAEGKTVKMKQYKGKVLLIVNTATHCGFTPQYTELESLYEQFRDQGFEILDFPCNQFGQQAPEPDQEYVRICKDYFHTTFQQFHKIDVNGDQAIPLYAWLKAQKGFAGFDPSHQLTPILEGMFDKAIPGWRESSDIKWNFTKFLVDREGNVVERFEPTASAEQMMPKIKALL